MPYYCFNCNKELTNYSEVKVARKDECPACKYDLHVCKNCEFYDLNAYNSCRESQAERVTDKDKSNFCDFFSFRDSRNDSSTSQNKKQIYDSLDNLFKK
jgi:hypothetical protein